MRARAMHCSLRREAVGSPSASPPTEPKATEVFLPDQRGCAPLCIEGNKIRQLQPPRSPGGGPWPPARAGLPHAPPLQGMVLGSARRAPAGCPLRFCCSEHPTGGWSPGKLLPAWPPQGAPAWTEEDAPWIRTRGIRISCCLYCRYSCFRHNAE